MYLRVYFPGICHVGNLKRYQAKKACHLKPNRLFLACDIFILLFEKRILGTHTSKDLVCPASGKIDA